MLLQNLTSSPAELICSLPPSSEILHSAHAEVIKTQMIFTHGQINLDQHPRPPRFLSTTITNESKVFTHLHCLITYEKISPVLVQESKDRKSSLKKFNLIMPTVSEDSDENLY